MRIVAVLVMGMMGCAHSNLARVTRVDPDGEGGRVAVFSGSHGRQSAERAMRGVCHGTSAIVDERLLRSSGLALSSNGAAFVDLQVAPGPNDGPFDREVVFRCEKKH